MKFSNFPYATTDEIEALVSEHPTLPKLENLERMNTEKFKFYQNSPFYKAKSPEHRAHLELFEAIIKKCQVKIAEMKGGQS